MKLDRDLIWNMLIVLAAICATAYVVNNTYWVDADVRDPPRDEAATDNHYAVKKIIERLGGKTVSPTNLDRLPPTNATLVLSSLDWDLFPEREKKLKDWVESGGHIVTEQWRRPSWIAVESKSIDEKANALPPAPGSAARASEPDTGAVDADSSAPPAPKNRALIRPREFLPRPADCFNVIEPEEAPFAFGERRSLRICNGTNNLVLQSATPVVWSMDSIKGPNILRIRLGKGAATVIVGQLSENRGVFTADHALAFVAALDLQQRPEVWFVDTEAREPLLTLIWRHGTPAVLLGFGLLALALWRAAIRFGPRAPVAPLSRRSVAEQIRGTSSFIFQRDSIALHKAQLRALEHSARRSIRDHDTLDRRSRAEAIAKTTALDADALARAMDLTLKRPRRDLLATLTLLETAVRRLAMNR
ncbi:MAG: hypothetical protein JF606_20670 [Burkholderiales bacterium]|nr:hypothetical protein [Burkholderiales bacterium]